jgi:predicted RND superfamily exporter protein
LKDIKVSKRKRIELMFEAWTRILIKFRFPILFLVLLPTFLIGSQVRNLSIDTSNEGLLHPGDPILTTYNEFRDQFGRDDILMLAIKSDDIFTIPYLTKLKNLHDQLEAEVPHVNDITSMINARDTRGQGDTLLVDDLLRHFPATDQDLAEIKERVMANPLYRNQLVSADSTFSTILIESDTYSSAGLKEVDVMSGFDDELTFPTDDQSYAATDHPAFLTDKENSQMVAKAEAIARSFNGPDFEIYIAGSPIVTHTVKQLMMKDMQKFLRLAVLTIGLCLFIMFRRISGVLLPLLVVAFTLITTLGLMAKYGVQFKVPTIILPSFLLAVGVGASVHVLSLVYQRLRKNDSKEEALVYALGHSGLAIVMTSLTTAAGLASFATAKVAPIADLGMFSSIGIVLSLLYTLILLPTLLAIFPLKPKKAQALDSSPSGFDRFFDWVAVITTSRPKLIVALSLLVVVVFAAGIPKLRFSHNLLSWLPEQMPVRVATETIDHNMRGSVALEVVLDTGSENGLYDPLVLQAMDDLGTKLENFEQESLFVGKVISVTTILKEIHKALHENRPEMYRIPENEALIPQEFLLFENSGSDDLQDFVDSRFSKARVTIKVPWRDALSYVPFISKIENLFKTTFAGITVEEKPVTITTTGIMSLFARILYATMYSAAQSYGIAILVITVMMILLIGDLRIGIIAMVPNISPILIVMGIMGWFSIPLDMFTMLVASIAIGLAVDDTIHFVYNFKKYYQESGDVHQAVRHTLHTAGRAMLTTSIVLSIGFFLFMFASMHNVFNFGMLVGLAIVIALLADFFLAPSLMALSLKNTTSQNEHKSSVLNGEIS